MGIAPAEFWKLTPYEFWAIYDARIEALKAQSGTPDLDDPEELARRRAFIEDMKSKHPDG